jgi:hypothetical protein
MESTNLIKDIGLPKGVSIQGDDDVISDDWIFSSEAFGEGDEYMACIGYFNKLYVEVDTNVNKYKINSRYIKHPDKNNSRKTICFTHGHSADSTWVTWIKSAVFLFNCDFDVLMIDLPGFGRSTVNGQIKVHFKNWLDDGPNLIKGILKKLNIEKISICGYCGGGALMIRTMSQFPELFDKYHIFYNLIISAYPNNFEKLIHKYKMNIIVVWSADPDHPVCSISYKWLKNHTKNKNPNIKLVNITKDDIISSGLWAKGYGRSNTDNIFILLPSLIFLNFMNSFFNENIKDYNK